jgi:hypothetical protein
MSKKLTKKYDCCPCWVSPCDPEGHKGSCESNDGGECRFPGDQEIWSNCQHFAKACDQCGYVFCELHADYQRYKDCHITGCKNPVSLVVNDDGVDIALCNDHFAEFDKTRALNSITAQKALAEQKKRYEPLAILEAWCKPEDAEINRSAKYKGDPVHPSGRLLMMIQKIRDDPQSVIEKGKKEGWLK